MNELDFVQAHPGLFSPATVDISATDAAAMQTLIRAIESVVAMPAWQSEALRQAAPVACHLPSPRGVFFGYDFHLTEDGPKLIEINTNAGGGMLNLALLAARGATAEAEALARTLWAMFAAEWRLMRGTQVLRRVAIVDERPAEQFLYPEFVRVQAFFAAHGVDACIVDPAELVCTETGLSHAGQSVDLIYNRLTDFDLSDPRHAHLANALMLDQVVLTPNPRVHALYADKRHLARLSDADTLQRLGVPEAVSEILRRGIPQTCTVNPALAAEFWADRRRWFFKPAAGFGSRAAYRGDKLTRRVFEEILQGNYVAQTFAPPPVHPVRVQPDAPEEMMKFDLRCYVYDGEIQCMAARLYQGQTTNFRTPGGGFAPVRIQKESLC